MSQNYRFTNFAFVLILLIFFCGVVANQSYRIFRGIGWVVEIITTLSNYVTGGKPVTSFEIAILIVAAGVLLKITLDFRRWRKQGGNK